MSNTMAEPFCEEHLITWTEHGQDFTDWRDGDIFTGSHRMSQAGAISLFHPLEEDHLLIVTVFRDRSWISPTRTHGRHPAHRGNQGGRTPHPGPHPPDAGGRAGRPGLRGRIQSFRHYVRSQLLQQKVQTAPARALSFLSVQHPFSPPPQGFLIPVRRPKMASDQKVQAFRLNRG